MGPASPSVAFKFGEKSDDPVQMYLSDIYTITGSLAGVPCMSVPCGKTGEGLPVGMQILTTHFGDIAKSVTINRNSRSRSAGIVGHDDPKRPVTMIRNTHSTRR